MATIPVPRSAAAQVARETNAYIRSMAESLEEVAPDERPIGLFCECGCMGLATATLLDYESAGGAWLEGHEPGASRTQAA
jgi:hypothetical protein